MRARIIAIGQRAAGDDAAGPAVLDRLRREKERWTRHNPREGGASRARAWADAELREAADAAALIPLLRSPGPILLIDAYVSPEPPGTVRELTVDALAADGPAPVSSHMLSVRQAIDLARTLYPDEVAPGLRIVGISIVPPEGPGTGLSLPVAEAVPRAAAAIARIVEHCGARVGSGNREADELRAPRETPGGEKIEWPRSVESRDLRTARWGS